MKKNYLKILMTLSVGSLLFNGCTKNIIPANRTILIDISGSNSKNVYATLNKVNDVYLESFPNDTFKITFFSSVKYLAYSGKKLNKDREFLPLLKQGYEAARAIKVKDGTSFDICKKEIEETPNGEIVLYTDGFFENSKISIIHLNQNVSVKIVGLNIQNNETMINCFSDPKKVQIDFQGK